MWRNALSMRQLSSVFFIAISLSNELLAVTHLTLVDKSDKKKRVMGRCDEKMTCEFDDIIIKKGKSDVNLSKVNSKLKSLSRSDLAKAKEKMFKSCMAKDWLNKKDKLRVRRACEKKDVLETLRVYDEIDRAKCKITKFKYSVQFVNAGSDVWVGQKTDGAICKVSKSYKLTKTSEYQYELLILKMNVSKGTKRCKKLDSEIPEKQHFVSDSFSIVPLSGCRYLDVFWL